VPGTAVFLSASANGVPPALLHNVKHNKILHDRVVILTVHIPGGFDRFTLAVGTPATGTTTMPPQEVRPDPAALAAIASSFGIEILGPPLTP